MGAYSGLGPDLHTRILRKKLSPRRNSPFFYRLRTGRSIGYKHNPVVGNKWIARATKKGGGFFQCTLGVVDDHARADGKIILSYSQALEKAEIWFSRPDVRRMAIPSRKLGVRWFVDYENDSGVFTIGDALLEYIEWCRLCLARNTLSAKISAVRYHIIPKIGDLPAGKFNREWLHKFIIEVLETPPQRGNASPGPKVKVEDLDEESLRRRKKIINTLICILRHALEMAWENEKFDNERAWRCLRRLPNVESRPHILHLSRNECQSLLDVCGADLRNVVLGALYTGCRFGELMAMTAGSVARDGYGVNVRNFKKSNRRFVFLPDEGMVFFLKLAEEKDADSPLFYGENGAPWKNYRRHPFYKAVKDAGLPRGVTFHTLRHTYASQLIQAGAPLIVVADQLGHKTIDTVCRTYGHLAPQIRESEVRQRFTSVDQKSEKDVENLSRQLQKLRESFHGLGWRSYATINDLNCVEHTKPQPCQNR